jgi:hypothetical protein
MVVWSNNRLTHIKLASDALIGIDRQSLISSTKATAIHFSKSAAG